MSCGWFEKYKESADSLPKAGKKPVVGITANYVEADSRLAEAYYESVRKAGGVAVIFPPSAGIEDIEDFLLSVDALVFSGGGDINPLLLGEEPERGLGGVCAKRDVQELVLMRRAIDKQLPVLAICRGMQVMAAATGGTLIQDIYSSLDKDGRPRFDTPLLKHSQNLDRDCVSHTIDIAPSTLLASILGEGRFAVNSFHHQAVGSVGEALRVSAKSPDGIIEAIESNEGKSLLGVQWHPECFHKSAHNPMKPLFEWLVNEAAEYRAAREIHRRVLTLDSHCDTPMFFDRDIDFSRRDDRILVDSVKMRDGGLDAVIMAAYLPQKGLDAESLSHAVVKAERLLDEIDERIGTVAGVALADSPKRLYELKGKGVLGVMKGIENGYAIGNDLANIEKFARRGVVYITLCHNGDNLICDSAAKTANTHGGLSDFGGRVVSEMNRLGLMVDLSHAGRSSFYNALEASRLPVVCSHASCRALCDHSRNLDDDQMRALRDVGGVMQITLYPGFLRKEGVATIDDAINHLNHAVDVMGIDHVGLGTDFDGDGGVTGLAHAGELLNFTRRLLQCRYSEDDIRLLWGGNFLRVMNEVQAASEWRKGKFSD